jgi:hypothetical protein
MDSIVANKLTKQLLPNTQYGAIASRITMDAILSVTQMAKNVHRIGWMTSHFFLDIPQGFLNVNAARPGVK